MNENQNNQATMRGTAYLMFLLVLSHASIFYPWCRRYFGTQGLGWNGLGAFLMLVLMSGADAGVRWYFFVWFALVVVHRLWSVTARWRGYVVHSWSRGEPYIARMVVKNERICRCVIEPVMCLIVGFAVSYVSRFLGLLIMSGFVSLLAVEALQEFFLRSQIQLMDDLEMDYHYLARMRRGGRDE